MLINNLSSDEELGNSKLRSYVRAIGADDSDLCECGQKETVKHVLLDCKEMESGEKRA